MERLSVLIADDNEVIRTAVRVLLSAEDDLAVVGEAGDGYSAVQLSLQHRPTVVLMDVEMPVMDGLEATRQIRQALPDVRVLILTAELRETIVDEARNAGAAGLLDKWHCKAHLRGAVSTLAAGGEVFPRA